MKGKRVYFSIVGDEFPIRGIVSNDPHDQPFIMLDGASQRPNRSKEQTNTAINLLPGEERTLGMVVIPWHLVNSKILESRMEPIIPQK